MGGGGNADLVMLTQTLSIKKYEAAGGLSRKQALGDSLTFNMLVIVTMD